MSEIESRIDRAFREGTPIDRGMNRGVHPAFEAHRQAGVPLVVWRVVYLDPTTLEEVPAPG